MDEFKKELSELLAKYPDLPEFSITIRPRIVIKEVGAVGITGTNYTAVPMPMGMPSADGSSGIPLPKLMSEGIQSIKNNIQYE